MTLEYSGSGDPARSMALLWRSREESARTGRSGLSVDRIVAAAIEIADADGLEALSMRRVAERLGTGAMSLYTYVPGKAELLDLMLDTVLGETARPDDVPGGWRERLEQIARENWALSLRHPWTLQIAAMARPPLGPNVIAKYDYELRAVAGLGLSEAEMDSVIGLVVGYTQGAARVAVEMGQAERHTGMTDKQWWETHGPLLARVFDPSRYPLAARVGEAAAAEYGSAYNPEYAFEFGLARILDGVAALIGERQPG
jgi:AcrR family transcriptional regulator